MALTLVTFKCGACNNLMAAAEDLRGRPVRCPHCQQVLQVPLADAVPALPAAPIETEAVAVPPSRSAPGVGTNGAVVDSGVNIGLPDITPAPEDSIHDARKPRDELFDDPDEEPFLDFGPGAAEPVVETEVVEPVAPEAPLAAPVESSPAVSSESPTFAWHEVAAQPVAAPNEPTPTPESALQSDAPHSWGPSTRAASRPEKIGKRVMLNDKSQPQARVKAKLPAATWALTIVVPYAITVTCICLFLMVRGADRPPHPLEALADDGLYKELQEGKAPTVVDPTESLPKDFKPVKLNETRNFGGIAVTPLGVSKERLTYDYFKTNAGPEGTNHKDEYDSLVLRLRIKNISNVVFHPLDPVFNCRDRRALKSYTYLQVRDKRFCGPIFDPPSERIKGQNFSELLPGQEMETIIIGSYEGDTPTRAEDVLRLVKKDESLLWRVQLRKGRETVQLKRGGKASPWTTTIVTVTFTPAEVSNPATSAFGP